MKNTIFACLMSVLFALNCIAQKFEVVKENESVFLVDKTATKPKKIQYNYIFPCSFSKDYVIADKGNLFLVNLVNGEIKELAESFDNLKIDSDTCSMMVGDYLRFKDKNKIGLMQLPDKIVLSAEFSDIYPKAENSTFFLLLKGKNWQFYYPKSGKFSILFQRIDATELYLDNGLTYLPDNQAVIVKSGEDIHMLKEDGTDYMLDKFFSKSKDLKLDGMSMILCIKDSKYGYVDQYANIQVPFIYEWAEPMEGTAIVKYDGKYGLLRDDGMQVIPCMYDKMISKSFEFIEATKEGKVIKLLRSGNPYDEFSPFEENNKFIFKSEDQKIIIPGSYDEAQPFSFGLAPVKTGEKWGFIIPTGLLLIPNQFEDARQFITNGIAPVKLNKKWGVIDFTGKFICEPQFDSIGMQDENSIILINKAGYYEFGKDKKPKLISIIPEKGSFIDSRDGKTYHTVKLVTQTWMAQNLDYKTDESWYYENSESFENTNGRLYTWKAALNACPAGWHLPSDNDWKILEKAIGMSEEELNSTDYKRGSAQASMLQNGGSTGFDIQMSGFKHGYDNNYYKMGEVCITWTSTPADKDNAWTRSFFPAADAIARDNNTSIKYGLPVRCVKD